MKIHGFIWMVIYIMMIPAFAGLYNSMPYEFYHTTNKYESYLQEDNTEIRTEMQEFFKRILIEAHGKQIVTKDSVLFDLSTIEIPYLEVKDDHVTFSLYGWFLDKDLKQRMKTSKIFSFSLNYNDYYSDTLNENQIVFSRIIESKEDDLNFKLKAENLFIIGNLKILHAEGGAWSYNCDCGKGYISKEIRDKLYAYSSALQGFPSLSSGNFERMLYLSATTITTLGTGDILPISARARLLVAIEAILGILIIGLYLNSLAKNIRNK